MATHLSAATWVRFLRNYGPIPTNDNMYDETIQRALKRQNIAPITLPAPLVDRLLANFSGGNPVSHIITGTAGDGKTYHCREVWTALGGDPGAWNAGAKVQTLAIGSRSLIIVKDLSELREEESAIVIADFARDVANPPGNYNLSACGQSWTIARKAKIGADKPRARANDRGCRGATSHRRKS